MRPGQRRPAALVLALLLPLAPACPAREAPPRAAVASAHPEATRAGVAILGAGGNAFDAAVAVAAALGVAEPQGSGLGGGGFWLLHRGSDGREVMIDGRERAPLAARRDLFLDPAGEPIPRLSLDGPLAAGIPGTPAALVHLARGYGRLDLAQSLAPAIRLAREGVEVNGSYRRLAGWRVDALGASPAASAQFLVDGAVPPPGSRLHQGDLALTLETLAREGLAGFYSGAVAERLVAGVRAAGGIWTLDDLADYRPVERAPVVGDYRGARVVGAPPPSSGGVLLIAMLNMVAALDPPPPESGPRRVHALAEVMRRAYRDRARWLGDPDQVQIPLERLIHPHYGAGLIRDFDPTRATPSLPGPNRPGTRSDQGRSTTHYSILDTEGNWVAATLSLNTPFGCGLVPPGTGVLLNNEMDDFSTRPGVPNAYGLVGGEANAIAPGRRMLSSMSPTFLDSPAGLVILGTPGGSRIPTMVLEAVLAATEGAPLGSWIARPRVHHQYLPDLIQYEPGALTPQEQSELAALGHRLEGVDPFGNLQAIVWDRVQGRVEAASDPRGEGLALVLTPESAAAGLRAPAPVEP
jgi:gamma-glutamyltranspeptidase/glutathione hydrolase